MVETWPEGMTVRHCKYGLWAEYSIYLEMKPILQQVDEVVISGIRKRYYIWTMYLLLWTPYTYCLKFRSIVYFGWFRHGLGFALPQDDQWKLHSVWFPSSIRGGQPVSDHTRNFTSSRVEGSNGFWIHEFDDKEYIIHYDQRRIVQHNCARSVQLLTKQQSNSVQANQAMTFKFGQGKFVFLAG